MLGYLLQGARRCNGVVVVHKPAKFSSGQFPSIMTASIPRVSMRLVALDDEALRMFDLGKQIFIKNRTVNDNYVLPLICEGLSVYGLAAL
jgi:hypothetical protein